MRIFTLLNHRHPVLKNIPSFRIILSTYITTIQILWIILYPNWEPAVRNSSIQTKFKLRQIYRKWLFQVQNVFSEVKIKKRGQLTKYRSSHARDFRSDLWTMMISHSWSSYWADDISRFAICFNKVSVLFRSWHANQSPCYCEHTHCCNSNVCRRHPAGYTVAAVVITCQYTAFHRIILVFKRSALGVHCLHDACADHHLFVRVHCHTRYHIPIKNTFQFSVHCNFLR